MRLTGLGVSPGIGVGKALVLKRGTRDLRFRVPGVARRARARAARRRARAIARADPADQGTHRATAGAEHAYLFDAQLLMLDDAMLIDRAAATIRTERLNAESALQRALDEISALFDQAQDPYLRERKGDVADVVGRLCMNLRTAGDPVDLFNDLEGPLVLVADELTPSVIAQLDWQRLAALVTDAGSWTYHTAILARSIHVPAVAGLHNASVIVSPGAVVAVDGTSGEVLVDPDAEALDAGSDAPAPAPGLRTFARRIPRSARRHGRRHEIRLEANIEAPEDAARAAERGRGGHRPVSIGVPARGRRPGGVDRGGAVPRVSAARRERRPASRHGPNVRRQRGPAPPRACRDRGGALAARPAWRAAQPRDRGDLPGAAARAAACGGARVRFASCFRSCRVSKSCGPRAARSSQAAESLRARGERCRTSRSAS